MLINLLIALAALTSPVWVVYLVVKFIQWQDSRKRTFGEVKVSKAWIERYKLFKRGFFK